MPAVKAAERKVLTTRIPWALHQQAKVIAAKQGVSLNSVVEDLLRRYVKHFSEAE